MNTPASFLIIALRRIGDVLLTTPLIHSIRAAYPDARVAALVFEGTGGILQGNPDLDAVHEIPAKLGWRGYRAFWREHGRRYDWAVSTQTGDRPTLLAVLAGRRRIAPLPEGADKTWWRRLLLHKSVADAGSEQHVVRRDLQLAAALGIAPRARLVAPAEPAFNVADALGFNPAVQAYVVCHPMPMFVYKRWPDANWRALIQRLQTRGLRVVISGGGAQAEKAAIQTMLGGLEGSVTNLAGQVSFAQLAEVLRGAAGFYGADTSVTHLAAACGIPVTAIFGPTDPIIWGPWPQGAAAAGNPWKSRGETSVQTFANIRIVQDIQPCVPCQEEGCERHIHSRSLCLEAIPVERVLGGAD